MRAVVPFVLLAACAGEAPSGPSNDGVLTPQLATNAKLPRYAGIRDAAAARGMTNGYLLAGIANDETGLAMCWSEATWACQGPSSPDCNGGPVIAGAADGPCSDQQGGLGMFQFDAGTYTDTINKYGGDIVTVAGQTSAAIDYATWMVKISAYTTNAETDDKARAWLDNFDPNNPTLVDQWISTVVRYYNGCQPGWSCWNARYQTYSDGFHLAISEPGGLSFWTTSADPIDAKYAALGGASGVLGAATGAEQGTPDGIGRYRVYANGSIYWTQQTGAFEVHGQIRDEWKAVGWEAGILGYPITDETGTPDGVGRYNVFQQGSIYWTPQTGAHEVHGRIRDAWKDAGWEAGELGYPISDEYAVTGGRRSDFQKGSITWDSSTDQTSITLGSAQ